MKNFKQEQEEIVKELNIFIARYEEFTKRVSQTNWATTGSHYLGLAAMSNDIMLLEEIADNEMVEFMVEDDVDR